MSLTRHQQGLTLQSCEKHDDLCGDGRCNCHDPANQTLPCSCLREPGDTPLCPRHGAQSVFRKRRLNQKVAAKREPAPESGRPCKCGHRQALHINSRGHCGADYCSCGLYVPQEHSQVAQKVCHCTPGERLAGHRKDCSLNRELEPPAEPVRKPFEQMDRDEMIVAYIALRHSIAEFVAGLHEAERRCAEAEARAAALEAQCGAGAESLPSR